MTEYNVEVWETGDYPNLYRKIGWTPNRMSMIDAVLVRHPKSMLEIGCLDGCYIEKLRSLGYIGEYLGSDITKAHIKMATEKFPEENFKIEDARSLSFRDKAFELVMLSDVVQHLPDAADAIAEAARVSSHYVLLSTYGSYGKTWRKENGRCFNVYYNKDDILRMIPDGWEITEFKTFKHPTLNGLTNEATIFHFYIKRV